MTGRVRRVPGRAAAVAHRRLRGRPARAARAARRGGVADAAV